MDVSPFVDEYDAVARLYGMAPGELRAEDAARGGRPARWIATAGPSAEAAADAWERPDGRAFLRVVGERRALAALGPAVASALGRAVHVTADAAESELLEVLVAAGFEVELELDRFLVPFDGALAWLRRAWMPSGYRIRSAADADPHRLFALDNALRNDVPGSDGWRGNWDWFTEELAEAPPFDPAAYLVAVHDASGDYAGLVRMWRNRSGPRLGLVGVTRHHRGTPLAAALLAEAIGAASRWGHEAFAIETATANSVIHPRLARLGAEHVGRTLQLALRPPHAE